MRWEKPSQAIRRIRAWHGRQPRVVRNSPFDIYVQNRRFADRRRRMQPFIDAVLGVAVPQPSAKTPERRLQLVRCEKDEVADRVTDSARPETGGVA